MRPRKVQERGLQLSPEEAQMLDEVLDLHLQGLRQVNDCVVEDPNIDNVDDLLEMTALTDRQVEVLENLRGRIGEYRYQAERA